MPVTVNRVSRVGKIRRFVLLLFLFTLSLAVLRYVVVENFVSDGFSVTRRPPSPYNELIDEAGHWTNYKNIRILQHVVSPLSQSFVDFNAFIDQNDEWKLYFKYVPIDGYHVVLAELSSDEDLDKLKLEQDFLDANRFDIGVKSEKIVFLDRKEIRVEVEYSADDFREKIQPLQSRWKERFPSSNFQFNEKFSVVVAVQFKDLPNDEMKEKIRSILSQWTKWSIDIELDPIEICTSENFIAYQPIRP